VINWQGAPTLSERFAPLIDVLWRAFAFATIMFLTVGVFNVVSFAIWQENAEIVLYPLFAFWLCAAVMAFQCVMSAWPEARLRLGLKVTLAFALMAPLVWISLVHWQWPVLRGQALLAQTVGDSFR
jgi:hypothetical protein